MDGDQDKRASQTFYIFNIKHGKKAFEKA